MNDETNIICEDCARWAEFKKDCHYYWNNKRECTKFCIALNDPDQFITEELALNLRKKGCREVEDIKELIPGEKRDE